MDEQAASSLIGVVLMIAVVVVLGGVVAGFGLGYAEELTEPAPTAAETAGSFNYTGGTFTCDTNQVEFTHLGGEFIAVSDLRIIVTAPDNPSVDRDVIHNLPTAGTSFDADNFEGSRDIVAQDCVRGAITDTGAASDGRWEGGDRIKFELLGSEVDAGDRIEVVLVHEPSGSIISERVFLA